MKKTAYQVIEKYDLNGKVFLITGPYSGLGAVSCKALLHAGATVILGGRSAKSQGEFARSLENDSEINFAPRQLDASHTLDLGDLSSVRDFASYVQASYPQIDCLMNNAGVMYSPPGKTKDGFEIQMGVNVIGHFLLAKYLVDITKRQVWVSSKGHTRLGAPRIDISKIKQLDKENYNPRFRYQQSKLGNILLAKQFAIEYPHLLSVSVHPGLVSTNLSRNINFLQKLVFMFSNPLMMMQIQRPEEGAATQVMLAAIPAAELVQGAYYVDCQVSQEAESARNMEDAKKLFDYCEKVTAAFQT